MTISRKQANDHQRPNVRTAITIDSEQ